MFFIFLSIIIIQGFFPLKVSSVVGASSSNGKPVSQKRYCWRLWKSWLRRKCFIRKQLVYQIGHWNIPSHFHIIYFYWWPNLIFFSLFFKTNSWKPVVSYFKLLQHTSNEIYLLWFQWFRRCQISVVRQPGSCVRADGRIRRGNTGVSIKLHYLLIGADAGIPWMLN